VIAIERRKMKKLLGIVVLGLLLVSCNNPEKEKLLALESCGDSGWYRSYMNLINKPYYENNYEKTIRAIKNSHDLSKTLGTFSKLDSIVLEEFEKIGSLNYNAKSSSIEIFKKVRKLSLDFKFEHSSYQFYFARCEQEYLEAPTTFITKWK